MKKSINKLLAISATAALLGLTACSHENPLKKQSLENSIDFIKAASNYAAKKVGYKGPDGDAAYRFCFTESFKSKSYCPELLKEMVVYAKEYDTNFSSITVEDLQNKEFIDSLKRTGYWFNVIPFE